MIYFLYVLSRYGVCLSGYDVYLSPGIYLMQIHIKYILAMNKSILCTLAITGLLCCGCRDGFTVRQALERAGENRPQLEAVLEHFKESGDRYILYYWDEHLQKPQWH